MFGYQCEHPALSPRPQAAGPADVPLPATETCGWMLQYFESGNSSSRRGPWEWKHFGSVVLKIKSEALAHPTYKSKKELAGEKGMGKGRG